MLLKLSYHDINSHEQAAEHAAKAVFQCQDDILKVNLALKDKKNDNNLLHELREKV